MITIKSWLDHCESSHGSRCMPKAKQVPHRLIEVGGDGSTPKLVLSEQISAQDQRYTTLSHCWGTSLPIRTLLSNIQSYSHRIPPQIIPRTFDDAIHITLELGIRFIWIDALCIVQDSAKEWEQEAAKMKDIYSGSVLNIAASDSSGSEGGCFPIKDSVVQTFHLAQVEGPELVVKLQPGDTRHLTKQTILSSRGWVLQEQLLSHRMISCMGDELHWECSEAYETEAGVHFSDHTSDMRGVPRMYQCPANLQQDGMWRSWMVNFSERKFTFWNDRLPALSGIVENYQEITGDISILGLWRRSIIQDLLWIRMGQISLKPAREIGPANLPSWSWLSCPSDIKFDIWQLTKRVRQTDRYVIVHDHCELMDFSVQWTGVPFMSTVKSAYVVLYGPTVEATIDIEEISRQPNPPPFRLICSNKHISCSGQFDRGRIVPGRYYCLSLRSRVHSQTNVRRDIFMILQTHCGFIYERVGIGCVYEPGLFSEAIWKRHLIH
ncbi:HET-domain-containing protein [Cucurbitaria berberidis CBS 394.84]|uniref:HET-domain-containing protein n=1 Tax=Cucurbitaria berberidis CBS 394.84 TaxID=1168544 RepID=A0A9P4GF22_9PLEO|nr:HET-domain-containing protein [Cucurbitaria berberidis CBS 394.84]KAF1844442.1 HET-domain-containing protein [Cucurbitaria berberidis CBS 394.84]